MRNFLLSVAIGLAVSLILAINSSSIHTDLSDNLIRLHVVADNDGEEAQDVKLKVRDRLLCEMSRYFENTDSARECEKLVLENMDKIVSYANDELAKCGVPYSAKAYYGEFEFPTKVYANVMLPRGRYNAVRVELGKAEGKNWWCVMFPPLCFTEESTGTLEDKEDKILKNSLDRESYDIITSGGKPDFEVKFKILELFGD